MKAIWIRSDVRTITEVEYSGLDDLRRMVGGHIEYAMRFNSDTLYVDEEGLLKNPKHFFSIESGHQTLAGNGVLVGREVGDGGRTRTPKSTLLQVQTAVTWIEFSDPIG